MQSAGCGKFCTTDLVFFLGYMVIVQFIGFWVGRREKATIADYFRAGNTLPWYAVGFSIIAAGISSEQFVGEMGTAYGYGMPIVNWEWMIFPALSILLWFFVPLYVRNRITTMPEYLEKRYGPRARTVYAILIIASYIFANFALVFYLAGVAFREMWGWNSVVVVWILAFATGAYTVYGGLASVAWTDVFQCVLLLGGGIYVFLAGMARPEIGWDFSKVLGEGARAHLRVGADHPVIPWTAMIILALSTNTWYYATDQFINQRCLGAKNEWHAKAGVLLAGGIQLIMPLATCFPGMIYYVINPNLKDMNLAYPNVVAEVVPIGLRGLVAAAVIGAIMSTLSGLVNSTSTMFTLDILRRWKGRDWSEMKLVRSGQWAAVAAVLVGAAIAPVVMGWESMFLYCQEIWAPMAAPVVVAFVGGALWKRGSEKGAVACMLMAVATVPLTFIGKYVRDHYAWLVANKLGEFPGWLTPSLQNSMVWAGGVYLVAIAMFIVLSYERRVWRGLGITALIAVPILWVTAVDARIVALTVLGSFVLAVGCFARAARAPRENMWDRSMLSLPKGETQKWYSHLWLWWAVLGAAFVYLYYRFW